MLISLTTACFVFFLTSSHIHFPEIPNKTQGKAIIAIEHLSLKTGAHQPSYIYKGKIISFEGNGIALKGVPFFLNHPASKKNRPPADCMYELDCEIKKAKGKAVIIKPLPKSTWKRIESFSFSEIRYQLKKHVKTWIERQFSSQIVIQFLSGLAIGEFDDRQLKQDLGRFGLLHLLAISGFHFNILANLLEMLLRPFLRPKGLTLALVLLLSIYFIFLGWGPSILRSWLTLFVYLSAYFHQRFSSPLNSLGFALLATTFIDPLLLETLGFQFSFLTTAAILLYIPLLNEFFHFIFPKRTLQTLLKWRFSDQAAYIILGFLKNGLSITFATTLIALPISLYYFHQFPFLSLFYNIFFPFLVSLSMGLLLLGAVFFFLPPFSRIIHIVNDYFTSFILNMTYEIPPSWDIVLQIAEIPLILMYIYMITILIMPIKLKKNVNRK